MANRFLIGWTMFFRQKEKGNKEELGHLMRSKTKPFSFFFLILLTEFSRTDLQTKDSETSSA
ncbi:MAG: hypothetical protein ACKVOS_03235 [Sphingorhabdus sp.]|uniref:hypothetical protein n=1 Tax=Sphingorhabdus sp. TaxID=1902408 RepID=UPI0038FC4CAF